MSDFDSEIEEDPNIGLVLGDRYRIDEPIASGSSGVVYRALQVAVDREVAVKILKTNVAKSSRARERFETEARAVAKLRDPHCITLFDFGFDEDADLFYMVFDYVDGESLDDLLPGPLPEELVLLFVVQIASALHHAHSHGILHRDLKPENVVLDRDQRGERARVLDFGLARIHEETRDRKRVTKRGEVYGTPAYMSPEQCEGEYDVGPETDVYALGCIAYELLEGRLPFEAPTAAAMLRCHVNDPVPGLSSRVPKDVAAFIQRMMAKDPKERPTAKQVIETLAQRAQLDISMEMTLGASTRSGGHFEEDIVAALDRGPAREIPTWLWIAGAIALVVIAACAVVLLRLT